MIRKMRGSEDSEVCSLRKPQDYCSTAKPLVGVLYAESQKNAFTLIQSRRYTRWR